MPKIGVNLSDDVAAKLRDYTLKKYGIFRGQSLVVEDALKEYFAKNEEDLKAEQGNFEGIPALA